MKALFIEKQRVAEDVWIFFFQPERSLRYIAGQFIELTLPLTKTDDRGKRRWFTLCSSPTEPSLAITTHINTSQPSAFKEYLARMQPNTTVDISEPMGDFVLPKDRNIPLVFVAAGIGITPYRSMVKWLIDKKENRPIELLYGASNDQQLVFMDLFRSSDITIKTLVGKRIDSALLAESVSNLETKQVYISGPEPMVEAFVADITRTKLKIAGLVTDYFHNYKVF